MAKQQTLTKNLGTYPNDFFALAIGVVLFAFASSYWNFATSVDDAHITFFAAHSLANYGEILNYNFERVEQSSSLLHTLLTALFARFSNMSAALVGFFIPLLFGWLCIPLLWLIARQQQLTLSVLLCVTTPLVYWTYAGLETGICAALLLLYVYCLSTHHLWLTALFGFTVQLVRPEMPIFIPLLTITTVIVSQQEGIRWRIGMSAISVMTALIIFCFRWVYFGDIFPQPVAAKSNGISIATIKNGFLYLTQGFHGMNLMMGVASILATAHLLWRSYKHKETSLIATAAITSSGYLIFIILAGGDWMPEQRLIAALTPIHALLVTRYISLLAPNPIVFRLLLVGICITQLLHNQRQSSSHLDYSSNKLDQHTLNQYTFSEKNSPDNRANISTIESLIPIIKEIKIQQNEKIQILSGQMGMVAYHLATQFPNQLHFTDRNGLIERSLTECSLTRSQPRVPQGIEGLATIFFVKKKVELKKTCNINPPDIIFDLRWHNKVDATRLLMAKHGYTTINVATMSPLLDQLILLNEKYLPYINNTQAP